MKFITTNFVKCPVAKCESSPNSFPLIYKNCELVQEEHEFNPQFIANMVQRLDWPAVLSVAQDLGNTSLPANKPELNDIEDSDSQAILKDLHTLLVETQIVEGEMHCGECNHIYYIKSSIPNFLLPPHLV